MEDEHHSCCNSHGKSTSVHQTLDEMDFERGIWQAALDSDISKIQRLLDRGVDVDALDPYGYTALHYACRQGDTKTVEFLLKSRASPNKVTRSGGSSCLHRAASHGHHHLLPILLASGAQPYLKDADGKTALHKAAESGRIHVCNVLVTQFPQLKKECDSKGMKASDLTTDDSLRLILQLN